MVHNKFTGIHIMDLHPLAGLASISFQLETSFKSSAAEGRKRKMERRSEGRKGERAKGKGKKEKREERERKGGRKDFFFFFTTKAI